jgi:adenylate kinase
VKRRIVLLGPPASGKGTIADRLQADFQLPIASPGAMLREEKAAGSQLGEAADRQTSLGQLVSDETINAVVGHWLERQTGDGVVFDGYPRTLGQAEALERMLAQRISPLQVTLLLEASLDTLRLRVENRAQCRQCRHIVSVGMHVASRDERCPRCGGALIRRKDDNAETLEARFVEYAAKTAPLIGYYEKRNLLQRVNTERPPDEVFADVRQILL